MGVVSWVPANAPEFTGAIAEADHSHARSRWRGVALSRVAEAAEADAALDLERAVGTLPE